VDPEWAAWGYFSLGLGGMDVKRERQRGRKDMRGVFEDRGYVSSSPFLF
jgi:hypothetical protein